MTLLEQFKNEISSVEKSSPTNITIRSIRRKLRYSLFRIREGKWQEDQNLKELKYHFEDQWQPGWSWIGDSGFTFGWDVSALNPLIAVSPFEWDGNCIKDETGRKILDPPAFTNQH